MIKLIAGENGDICPERNSLHGQIVGWGEVGWEGRGGRERCS